VLARRSGRTRSVVWKKSCCWPTAAAAPSSGRAKASGRAESGPRSRKFTKTRGDGRPLRARSLRHRTGARSIRAVGEMRRRPPHSCFDCTALMVAVRDLRHSWPFPLRRTLVMPSRGSQCAHQAHGQSRNSRPCSTMSDLQASPVVTFGRADQAFVPTGHVVARRAASPVRHRRRRQPLGQAILRGRPDPEVASCTSGPRRPQKNETLYQSKARIARGGMARSCVRSIGHRREVALSSCSQQADASQKARFARRSRITASWNIPKSAHHEPGRGQGEAAVLQHESSRAAPG